MAALADFARTCLTNHIRLIVVFPPSYHNGLFTREGTGALADVLQKKESKTLWICLTAAVSRTATNEDSGGMPHT